MKAYTVLPLFYDRFMVHVERAFTDAEVRSALGASGLRLERTFAELRLDPLPGADEERIFYPARKEPRLPAHPNTGREA